jgi:hypothetical protein
MQQEIWKDINKFEGIYQVSNFGRVKSFKQFKDGLILSNKNSNGGYLSLILSCKTHKLHTRIHRLVAQAFIPNPENKPEVNHRDGNKQNNHVDNLEWTTRAENSRHAIESGLADFKGMNFYNQVLRPKAVNQFDLNGCFIESFINCKEASRKTGVCSRNIHQVAAKTEYKPGLTRKQAGGFIWEFKEDCFED